MDHLSQFPGEASPVHILIISHLYTFVYRIRAGNEKKYIFININVRNYKPYFFIKKYGFTLSSVVQ